MILTEKLKQWCRDHFELAPSLNDDETFRDLVSRSLIDETLPMKKFRELSGANGSKTGPSADDVFGGNGSHPRVKNPSERYNTTKSVGKHVRTGQPVKNEHGREVVSTSEAEYAKVGAWLKFRAMKDGMPGISLTEHERALTDETFGRDLFCGKINGEWKTDISGSQVKALISDSGSGGAELNPIFFDEAMISFPLLFGELLPLVDLRPVPRGSSVEGASIGNPTLTWNVAEGTSIDLFDTAALAAEINTTIFPVAVAVEIGRDLMADAPADIGRVLLGNITQRMLSELDDVIARGDGTSQPEGVINATGVTDNAWGGDAATVADYEGLLFGVGKQYRQASSRHRQVFCSNDTSYARARGIAVGTADQRRVFGMDHEAYTLLNHGHKIVNGLANTDIFYGNMASYRLYRRQAQEVVFESGGKELARKNLSLLIVRGRYGGRVVDSNAFTLTDDALA